MNEQILYFCIFYNDELVMKIEPMFGNYECSKLSTTFQITSEQLYSNTILY